MALEHHIIAKNRMILYGICSSDFYGNRKRFPKLPMIRRNIGFKSAFGIRFHNMMDRFRHEEEAEESNNDKYHDLDDQQRDFYAGFSP